MWHTSCVLPLKGEITDYPRSGWGVWAAHIAGSHSNLRRKRHINIKTMFNALYLDIRQDGLSHFVDFLSHFLWQKCDRLCYWLCRLNIISDSIVWFWLLKDIFKFSSAMGALAWAFLGEMCSLHNLCDCGRRWNAAPTLFSRTGGGGDFWDLRRVWVPYVEGIFET